MDAFRRSPAALTTIDALRRVTAALLVGAMAAVVVEAVQRTQRSVHALQEPQAQAAFQRESDRMTCLEALLRERVPMGAFVLEDDPQPASSQRIPELLTPGLRPVDEPLPGAYVVHFVGSGPCSGAGVSVAKVDQP